MVVVEQRCNIGNEVGVGGNLGHNVEVDATFLVVMPEDDCVNIVIRPKIESDMLLEGR